MSFDCKIRLLSKAEVLDNHQLEIFKKSKKCAITDFAILLGGIYSDEIYIDSAKGLRDRAGEWQLSTNLLDGDVFGITCRGELGWDSCDSRTHGIRPVLYYTELYDTLADKLIYGNQIFEIEYGEYPQYVVDESLEKILESNYLSKKLKKTGKMYTTDSRDLKDYEETFLAQGHDEYEYDGKHYVRVKNNSGSSCKLSNGKKYNKRKNVWLEVSPIKWIVDPRMKILISEKIIASGVRFCIDKTYKGNFYDTEMFEFLNNYFAKEIGNNISDKIVPLNINSKEEKGQKILEKNGVIKQNNPYSFQLDEVSEEEIIKGAIESGVAVFLHGPSSEGKSARVKQLDPDCIIIYLRNATPDSLNGKSVYNSETGEMVDIKPSWLRKLEELCEKKPDKKHIVFFDEITNALPSIQGIAFNIVLDREVNGIWKLPENARIVAAGNDMKDSLAANQLAEPLFNRFAHVYIKTTTESWLKWASENNIHPAIYTYIAYRNGETLRSEYNGITPNADPRKWELASKMLYKTGKPEMLRALVGEDITREFVEFCKNPVITLEDVKNKNYNDGDIESLNTAEKYATVMGLSQVDEENLNQIRNFVSNLGAEFVAIFDALWIHGDESRLEIIAENKLAEATEGGFKR